jgi:two-component system chemotaxis sensor kinase CheA
MNLDAAKQTFLEEARELLEDMERILLDVEATDTTDEQLNALFRAMHTIKGSAGLFGMDEIVHFTHEAENVVDLLRGGHLTLGEDLSGLLLRCHDHVKAMLAAVDDKAMQQDMLKTSLLDELRHYARPPASHDGSQGEAADAPEAGGLRDWVMSLRFGEDVLRNGMDPSSFFRYLRLLGEFLSVQPVITRLPGAERFDAESCYLRFELLFSSDASQQMLLDVFEFVREDSQIHIFPVADAARHWPQVNAVGDEAEQAAVSAAWRALGLPVGAEEEAAAVADTDTPATVASKAREPEKADKPAANVAEAKPPRGSESRFIKVEAAKLDSLINLIGELVIAGAAANLMARRSGQGALVESTVAIANLIEQIRAGTLSMRMVQIGEIFSRFPRVVRDVSKELGKSIQLNVSGADTELDKSMVDKLGDPLMHIVRNAIDHGIESSEARLAAGKPAEGNVWLNAYHESGSVVIEVADDGAGLRKEKILAKAVANGLVAPDAMIPDGDIYKLIFEPGFSTAEQVTNISGRGVGMDVVRRSIEQLRGTIDIDSAPGEGTTFRIRLPLTLAIIDGFLVSIGNATFVIPLETVIECIELPPDALQGDAHNCLNLRGDVLPMLSLNQFLELGQPPAKRQNVVVVRYGDSKAGLVVDELLGEFQTVIKPLGSLFRHLRAMSGSTILGSGEVALILDVPSLIHFATSQEAERFASHAEHAQQRGGHGNH